MNDLPTVVAKSKKRVGRGVGSGKGFHTTGRGQKGQKARYKVGILFEGVKTKKSLLHRLPMLPGKDKFKARPKRYALEVSELNALEAGEVTLETLVKNELVTRRNAKNGVKIVGAGEVTKVFAVKLPVSAKATMAIEAAGGTIA